MTSNLKQKRFFQCLVATNSCSSISLLQPEALLFPSIFYHQLPDGTCPGAIPYFLYDSDKFCKKYGFAGLLENFRVRLTDISLSTSSHQRYIQYMADCIINLNLMGKHTNRFFWERTFFFEINNTSTKLFKKLSFELNDTNCRVKELHRQFQLKWFHCFWQSHVIKKHIQALLQSSRLSRNFTQTVIKK